MNASYAKYWPMHFTDVSKFNIGRTDAETEAPILWPPDAKNWLIEKDPDAGKDWRQEEKGMTEDEMVGCHHWLNRHEFVEQAPGFGHGQRSLAGCSPWGRKESDTTEQLNWANLSLKGQFCEAGIVTNGPPNLWDPYPQIQPTMDWKYSGQKRNLTESSKMQKLHARYMRKLRQRKAT